ncbi:uncharacterized protein Dwil_GK25529 [Drosophila willistoni]|uniref:Uncharacterized protein n=1 Tax=Drosophila willistoni TaxID=7260 RepID=B4N3R3_DROWI|nr:uncharacterized protein LOC6645197 [Drosophila willistoni]EDW79268.1 uncharacterized protein Dwil_GK25529 [Drosophila willistoni]
MKTVQLWFLQLISFCGLIEASSDALVPKESNLTDYVLARQKRHQLIYENGGTIRLVVGPVMATQLEDPGVTWRSLVYYYTLHFGGYTLPSAPLYPWDKWETIYARSLQKQIQQLDSMPEDDTRVFAYAALERYMDQVSDGVQGRGHECLMRNICENAQIHQHVGIMAELVNILLTPGKALLDEDYKEAYAAGLGGVDCLIQFKKCPRGASILDEFIIDANDV